LVGLITYRVTLIYLEKKMKVRITDLAPVNSGEENVTYIANSVDDCRYKFHRSLYEMVESMGGVWTLGKAVAEPVEVK